MINKTLLLLLFVVTNASAQKKTEPFESQKLNETRDISIILPASYESSPNKKYPLLLLLDGEYLVDPFAGILSYTNYWDDLPEVIIVGIHQNKNNQRVYDSQTSSETGLPDESGNKFFEFISMELLPRLEKKYRVAPFKIIAGHDRTAGFLNFFLYKDQPAFNAYISFSPELPDGMDVQLPEMLSAVKKPIFYYLATADGDVGKLKKSTKALDEKIKAVKNTNLRYAYYDFKGASHYSLVAHGIPSAIYHIFSSYQPITSAEYQSKLVTLPSDYVRYLEDRYSTIEKDLGVSMTIRLNDFKAVETAIVKNGKYEELKELASLAKKNYPKTILSEYYMALFYEKTGNFEKAIKTCMNSYSLNDIGEYTKDFMLEKAENLKRGKTD
ncbi:MAG: alpha/beta hydrolase [Flavobacterium sp.]|nr:MAG: alpha/beta hydrolase [Flavobacterium sp.]